MTETELDHLEVAAVSGQAVEFDYEKPAGEIEHRRVVPGEIRQAVEDGHEFLIAEDLDRQGWRNFRLDRIDNVAFAAER